ncbi:type I-C CRISPR-associated protein Cas8c/Csd1 [uncultured Porphyromonas sp.]|jgi:CRISPR-associated protein Csd1|uniref:type I-C CRISPR-associated protein Cas8c/Csd1 n=1 Tax=uncultured Porphyromonas sp. TaxID=159274 RepID=UPI0026112312|nr:type I-C CRISPR-associated protein Cas8c/Csd1 [uncultured Porphyromonas sp.]
MILQALYNYYEAMRKAHRIATPGLEVKPIGWVIVIREDGSFVRLKNLKDPSVEKSKGQDYLVPIAKKRSGQRPPAQPFWDNRKYILGYEESTEGVSPCMVRFEDFKRAISEVADLYPDNACFKAVCRFYEHYRGADTPLPEDAHTDRVFAEDWMTFQLQGDTELLATQDDAYDLAAQAYSTEENLGRCLITGEEKPLAAFHARIVAPGSQAGATIASFNDPAYLSYGKKQGENAPISKYASFAHTTALNELLRNEQTRYTLGDISYVFWNSNLDDPSINETFRTVTFEGVRNDETQEQSDTDDEQPKRRGKSKKKAPNPTQDTYKVLEQFKAIRGNRGKGQHWEDERQFYVLGLTAGGRITIKYWQQGTVLEIFDRVYQHLVDMNIVSWDGFVDEENPPLRSLYGIVKSVSTPSKSSTFATNLVQSIVESILSGNPYPMTLQQACINRITQERTVSELRAGILKGCINRKARIYKQLKELDMALDKQNDNIAYLAGRLFAVLEQIQQASLGKGVNATIRDRFYASASTRPNMVMGRLIALSNHHLSKLRKEKPGLAVNLEKLLEEIFALIPAEAPTFPATFSLDEQSLFGVGYYHQKVDTYRKEETTNPTEETEQ